MLIGLRTRELLQQMLEARCRVSPLVMVIEDLHWLDNASEEFLTKIVAGDDKLRLLIITTRRPESSPPWLEHPATVSLFLEPLPRGDIRDLIVDRLSVAALPEGLAQQVIDRAEGNPLFAEEIVSYLVERGVVRGVAGALEFDANAASAAIPMSVQNVLAARVDRLATPDRMLLQAASVIGRSFDPTLLASVVGQTVADRITAMQALDLVIQEGTSNGYAFKHALVRDALYQSLLVEPRKSLHLKIADEIERRSGNRLVEVAEVLARHYSHTEQADKAFVYLSMAGRKSLSVYSLDEATVHLNGALAVLDKIPDCASDDQVAEFFVSYTLLLNMTVQVNSMIEVLDRYLERIARLGDDPRIVLIRHQYVFALIWNARYREAAVAQRATSLMADRLGDSRSKAYSLTGEIWCSTTGITKALPEFETIKQQAIKAASATADTYIQNIARWVVGWEELHRGRIREARDAARELMQVGSQLNDPRSTGLCLWMLTFIAFVSDTYAEALEYSEQSLAVTITPMDRIVASAGKGCALVLLRRTEEGAEILRENRHRCLEIGYVTALSGSDAIVGVCEAIRGDIASGIRIIEEAILQREKEGYQDAADWYRLFLAEVYLQVIARTEKPTMLILIKNLPTVSRS